MTALVSPKKWPRAFDNIVCGGQKWQGIVIVEDCDREYEIQTNKAKGSSGASTNPQGAKLAEPKLTFVLWEGWQYSRGSAPVWVDYFAEWEKYRPIFAKSTDPKNPTAIVIEHVFFELAGIKSCVVKRVRQPKIQSDGRVFATVELLEYQAPKKVSSGAISRETKAPDKSDGKPKTAAQQKLDEKSQELESLTKQLNAPNGLLTAENKFTDLFKGGGK